MNNQHSTTTLIETKRAQDPQWAKLYKQKQGTFIGWCMLNMDYTFCGEIYLWIKSDKKMAKVKSYDHLIEAMMRDSSGYFNTTHFNKVDQVYAYYSSKDPGFHF